MIKLCFRLIKRCSINDQAILLLTHIDDIYILAFKERMFEIYCTVNHKDMVFKVSYYTLIDSSRDGV